MSSDAVRWKNMQHGVDVNIIRFLLKRNNKDEKWLSQQYGCSRQVILDYIQEIKEMPVLLYFDMKIDMERLNEYLWQNE